MFSAPSVSVVIATYNRANVIGRALDSVAAQTFQPTEIIIVDDASNDDTSSVVAGWSRKTGTPVTCIVAAENGGAGAARNIAMRRASGEFIAFLDSDDTYRPQALATLIEPLTRHRDVVVSFADAMQHWDDGSAGYSMMRRCIDPARDMRLLDPALPEWHELADPQSILLATSIIPTCAAMFRRDAAERVGLMPEYRHGEDWIFWLKLTGQGRFALRLADLADIYRQGDNQTGARHDMRNSRLTLNALLRLQRGDFGVPLTETNRQRLTREIADKAAAMRYWHSRGGLRAYWAALGSWEAEATGGRWGHLTRDPRSVVRALGVRRTRNTIA